MALLDVPLSEIQDFVVSLARQGGQLIIAANPSSFDNLSKKNSMSLAL